MSKAEENVAGGWLAAGATLGFFFGGMLGWPMSIAFAAACLLVTLRWWREEHIAATRGSDALSPFNEDGSLRCVLCGNDPCGCGLPPQAGGSRDPA